MKELYSEVNDLIVDPTIAEQVKRLHSLSLRQVLQLKVAIERELDKNFDSLLGQGLDLTSPLVTDEGFPRQDIDVLQVRLTRRYVNMLRNDLRDVIDHSQTLLSDHFQEKSATEMASESSSTIPFARIYDLLPNGPLQVAGVVENDRLIAVGSINATNHSNLSLLQKTIRENENVALPMRVQRDSEILELTLTPNTRWGGPGLLGAKLKLL